MFSGVKGVWLPSALGKVRNLLGSSYFHEAHYFFMRLIAPALPPSAIAELQVDFDSCRSHLWLLRRCSPRKAVARALQPTH